jgi:arginase
VGEIQVIAVPYELGRLRDGVGLGPERLLEHGAAEALAAAGARVDVDVIELERGFDNEIDASFELVRLVAERVRAALDAGAFPVVLSGSCFAAVGAVAGLGERRPGVVWFDAHADFNVPETSPSGYLDGMGVAVLTGSAWQALLASVPNARPIAESSVVLAGARDFDDAEVERLADCDLVQVPPDRLAAGDELGAAVRSIEPAPTGLYVHVDLDVIDLAEAPVNRYSAPGGISAARLEALVAGLLDGFEVGAVSLTAYEPRRDADDRVPPIASRLLSAIGERVASAAPPG